MQFHRAIGVVALLSALLVSGSANAFETTSIGGANADGSAKYADPDELSAATAPEKSSSPFGNFNFQVGSGADADSGGGTNWLNSPGTSGFGFSGSQDSSTSEAVSPFNTPILRERN
jgi:hypothetical protein